MINPVFAITLVVGVLLPVLPSKDLRTQRRLYWIGTLIASVSAYFALYPPDWGGGLALTAAVVVVMVLRAYMGTSHIRIGGRIYAFKLSDSHADTGDRDPEDDPAPASYAGFATATKTWWLFVFISLGCAFIVAIYLTQGEGPWYALGATLVIMLISVLAGNQDSSWGYPVARGQWAPFALTGIVTVGAFTAMYLLAYAIGKRWPLRPKRSLEHRTHPHLGKKFQ